MNGTLYETGPRLRRKYCTLFSVHHECKMMKALYTRWRKTKSGFSTSLVPYGIIRQLSVHKLNGSHRKPLLPFIFTCQTHTWANQWNIYLVTIRSSVLYYTNYAQAWVCQWELDAQRIFEPPPPPPRLIQGGVSPSPRLTLVHLIHWCMKFPCTSFVLESGHEKVLKRVRTTYS